MKLFKTLTLAAAVMIGSTAWADMANSMEVEFPAGSDSATLVGAISGHNYDSYRFWAKKGQLLTINLHGSDPQIQTSLLFKGKANGSNRISEILPYSGMYELRVLQTSNDANKSNAERQYNLVLKIQNHDSAAKGHNNHLPANKGWTNYTCDDKGKLSVQFQNLRSNNPRAAVNYNGKYYNLAYDVKASEYNERLFFTSKDQIYGLNVDISKTPSERNPQLMEIITFTKQRNGSDAVVVQNCLP